MTQTPPTMIEAVAEAMSDALYGDTHSGRWQFGLGDVNLDEEFKNRFRKMARAAIEAMKTPGDAMHFAGREAMSRRLSDHSSVWQAMIQAALGEKG